MSDVTKEIAKYILDKRLSVEDLESALHIPKQKLMVNTKERLTAEEFLRLCAYLKIRPESYYPCVEGAGDRVAGKGKRNGIKK